MDRDELVRKIKALEPEFAKLMRSSGCTNPIGNPWSSSYSADSCSWVTRTGSGKHKDTRRYLNVDEDGRTFRYLGEKRGYEQIPIEDALQHVFDEVESLSGYYRDEHHPPEKRPKVKHFDSRERNRRLFAECQAQDLAPEPPDDDFEP